MYQPSVLLVTREVLLVDELLHCHLYHRDFRAEAAAELGRDFVDELVVGQLLAVLHDPDEGGFDDLAPLLVDPPVRLAALLRRLYPVRDRLDLDLCELGAEG